MTGGCSFLFSVSCNSYDCLNKTQCIVQSVHFNIRPFNKM